MSSLSNTNACEYAQLGRYNNNKCGTMSTPDTKLTVIPSYGSPGYLNAFGQNPSTCDNDGSYQNIEQAYGSLYDNKQYINRLCKQPIVGADCGSRNMKKCPGHPKQCYSNDRPCPPPILPMYACNDKGQCALAPGGAYPDSSCGPGCLL